MLCTAWIPPKDLQTPRRLRSGCDVSHWPRTSEWRLPPCSSSASASAEEQPLEPQGRATLLVLEHALRVLARTSGRRRRRARWSGWGRRSAPAGLVRSCSVTKKPMPAWMAPSTVVTLVVTTSTTRTSEKLGVPVRRGDAPAARCCRARRRCRRSAPESAKTTMRCQVGFTPRPAVAVSLPRMAARLRPTVPLRTCSTTTTATIRTPSERRNMAWPSKLKNALVPSHFDWMLVPSGPPVIEIVVEGRGVEEQREPPGSSAPGPARAGAATGGPGATATTAASSAPTRPPDEEVQPEVVGEQGRREGADAGEGGLAQRQLARHAGDQRDREQDDREGQAVVEDGRPR